MQYLKGNLANINNTNEASARVLRASVPPTSRPYSLSPLSWELNERVSKEEKSHILKRCKGKFISSCRLHLFHEAQ
jgi:hypothetical protein